LKTNIFVVFGNIKLKFWYLSNWQLNFENGRSTLGASDHAQYSY